MKTKLLASFILAAAGLAGLCAPAQAHVFTDADRLVIGPVTSTGRLNVTATQPIAKGRRTWQISGVTGSGTGAATVLIECSLDGSNWDTLSTITLTLSATSSSGSFSDQSVCRYYAMNVTALSGIGATITTTVGY